MLVRIFPILQKQILTLAGIEDDVVAKVTSGLENIAFSKSFFPSEGASDPVFSSLLSAPVFFCFGEPAFGNAPSPGKETPLGKFVFDFLST